MVLLLLGIYLMITASMPAMKFINLINCLSFTTMGLGCTWRGI